jgi:hypothetical protein
LKNEIEEISNQLIQYFADEPGQGKLCEYSLSGKAGKICQAKRKITLPHLVESGNIYFIRRQGLGNMNKKFVIRKLKYFLLQTNNSLGIFEKVSFIKHFFDNINNCVLLILNDHLGKCSFFLTFNAFEMKPRKKISKKRVGQMNSNCLFIGFLTIDHKALGRIR